MNQGLQSSADTTTRRPTAPGRGSSSGPTSSARRGGGSVVWTLLALALVAGILYAENANSGGSTGYGWSLAGGASSGTLSVSGFAVGLYPGFRTSMKVKVQNGGPRVTTVTRIRVTVGSGASGCPGRTLRVGGFTGSRRVGSGRTWRLWIPVAMRVSAGDACQGARYPLLFVYTAGG